MKRKIINYHISDEELMDRVVFINRTSKVVKGGRRFGFSALVVVGDGKGHVGYGQGKAKEVVEAIRKGKEAAKRNIYEIPLDEHTIPHDVVAKFGGAKVLLMPAVEGHGVIAGSAVRAVMEVSGIQNVVTKLLGSSNPYNVVKAVFKGFEMIKTAEEYAAERGVDVASFKDLG